MNDMKAILTIGIPCSGKSTWAEKFCREKDYREKCHGLTSGPTTRSRSGC